MEDEFNNAKQTFECDHISKNASDFNTAKEKLEHFYEGKLRGIIICARRDGVNTVKRVQNNIFSIWRKGTSGFGR